MLEDARPHRRDAVRGARRGDAPSSRTASRRRARARSGPAGGPARHRARSSSRPCGTAGTCRRCRRRPWCVVAPGYVRSQFARCDSTTPFGRPVLPLVKKMTCGSRSSSSRTRPARVGGTAIGDRGRANGIADAVGELGRGVAVRRGRRAAAGRARTRRPVAPRRPTRARSAARRPRRAWRARRTPGAPRARCRPTTGPDRRARCRVPARPLATWFAAASSSPNVIDVVVERRRDRVRRDARRVGEDLADQQHGPHARTPATRPPPNRARFPSDNDC